MILKALCASSLLLPIAIKTCDGSLTDAEQALPLDAEIPAKSNPNNIGSPSTESKEKLTLLGSL